MSQASIKEVIQVTRSSVTENYALKKDDEGFERIVFSEVIVPESVNASGDFHSKDSVREFAYAFMASGFGIDLEHDNIDISDRVFPVESFIAREGDTEFIVGAWVIGSYIGDDDIWQKIVDRKLNGYSYQAMVELMPAELDLPVVRTITGRTEPDLEDGHSHKFLIVVDATGNILAGGTDIEDGHSHTISRHTFTDNSDYHVHIFNYISGSGGL